MASDSRRWQRGCFTELDQQLLLAPVWGGGTNPAFVSLAVGADNETVFRNVAGLTSDHIQELTASRTIGQQPINFEMRPSEHIEQDIQRGLISRVDPKPHLWRETAATSLVTIGREVSTLLRHRILEVGDSVAVAYVGKLFADLGWEVIRVERPDTASRLLPYRWGPSSRGADAFLNHAKQSMVIETDEQLSAAASEADIVVGDDRVWDLHAVYVTACLTPFGYQHDEPWS